jgi:hypothetical protein
MSVYWPLPFGVPRIWSAFSGKVIELALAFAWVSAAGSSL